MNYLKRQLARITSDNHIAVKFIDNAGETKWLSLTPEQFRAVKALLIGLEDGSND